MGLDEQIQRAAETMTGLDVNPRKFKIGSVVYYLRKCVTTHGPLETTFQIRFGLVSSNNMKTVEIYQLRLKDHRLVNGIPYKDFDVNTVPAMSAKQYFKYMDSHPGAWKTDPFCETSEESVESYGCGMYMDDAESLLRGYKAGRLVKSVDLDHSYLSVKEEPGHNMRLCKKQDDRESVGEWIVNIPFNECFASFAEAKEYAEKLSAGKSGKRISDEECSIRDIEHTIAHWANVYGKSPRDVAAARHYLLTKKNIEDVYVSIRNGDLVWQRDRSCWYWMGVAQ